MTERGRIEELVVQELDEANNKYPLFHSPHEAYAVLREEAEELEYEIEQIKVALKYMWVDIKNDIGIEGKADRIYAHAIHAAQEARQVAAMCEKIKQSELY